ncbi:DUF1127 domain-containing protein [Rhizobiaceae bacterium n13]|uniref:DUF1127 domain-containing protein n=1 Tax=Ferirhizobium litorale TaxID=2927786 RepID=A0AAE3QB22_9HYPH|nr:DUF1127 domain-containing protein [Fererhizobium litorale]MDI7864818.1 DUF1127 domain-containing protein [Fererhizobium litorale]MDI7921730.1 DUF1127 domain-containing protein [Fererhizobium litorale]
MRTTERTIDLDLAKPGRTLLSRIETVWSLLKSARQRMRNRAAVCHLQDLDDYHLRDIGLTRAEVDRAILTSTFFEDPSRRLNRSRRR